MPAVECASRQREGTWGVLTASWHYGQAKLALPELLKSAASARGCTWQSVCHWESYILHRKANRFSTGVGHFGTVDSFHLPASAVLCVAGCVGQLLYMVPVSSGCHYLVQPRDGTVSSSKSISQNDEAKGGSKPSHSISQAVEKMHFLIAGIRRGSSAVLPRKLVWIVLA